MADLSPLQDSHKDIITVVELKQENERLKEQLNVLKRLLANGSPYVSSECLKDDVIATVIFHNSSETSGFRKRIESFIHTINSVNESEIDIDDHDEDEETHQPSSIPLCGGVCGNKLECNCEPKHMTVTGVVEYHKWYVFDWLGSPMIVRGAAYCIPDELRVLYEQVYTQPFWISGYEEKEELKLKKVTMKCFNCEDYHHMKECPKPINPFVVARNRIQYQQDNGLFGIDKRYYLELADQERFNKFEPGKMSDKLCLALSLQDGGIPLFISRMKEHGYPPGWKILREEILKMFDENGEEISCTIPTKDIIYPGFNDKSNTLLSSCIPEECVVDDDELGHISDYEFEMEDEGGFALKKLIKEKEIEDDDIIADDKRQLPQKRSLDFPPGLVEINQQSNKVEGRWCKLIQILEMSKKKKRRM